MKLGKIYHVIHGHIFKIYVSEHQHGDRGMGTAANANITGWRIVVQNSEGMSPLVDQSRDAMAKLDILAAGASNDNAIPDRNYKL